jgi:CheY-like chemotaxis protein
MAFTTISEQPSAAHRRAPSGNGAKPVDYEQTLLSIRQARDTVLARNLELTRQLAVAEDRIAELEDDRDSANSARDAALALSQDLSTKGDELRGKLADALDEIATLRLNGRASPPQSAAGEALSSDEIAALQHKVAELEEAARLAAAQHEKALAMLTEQLAGTQRARDIAVAAVTNAQKQIEHLNADRKTLRAQFDSEKATLEARLAAAEAQLSTIADSGEPAHLPPDTAVLAAAPADVLDATESSISLAAMRAYLETLEAAPDNLDILEELDERLHEYAARGGAAGCAAIARFASACGELTRWLRKAPRKVSVTLPALRDALDLLHELSTDAVGTSLPDPAGAIVYSVDDDVDNCECIAMALEKIALQTRYSINPQIALEELSEGSCDLIILDVDLPGMSGIDLYTHIRKLPHHAGTPVVFLSGLMSTRERIDALEGGRRIFVPKPYNLNELGVMALAMILRTRLAQVEAA